MSDLFVWYGSPLRHEHYACPNEPRDHHEHTETVRDQAERAIEVELSQRLEDVFPVMPLGLRTGAVAEQHELEHLRVWRSSVPTHTAGIDICIRLPPRTGMKRPSGAKMEWSAS